MESLYWVALALVIAGVLASLVGVFGRPRWFQAGVLLVTLGVVVEAVHDFQRGAYGWLIAWVGLGLLNIGVFVWYRRTLKR